jgi:heavy metal sensor kinase
MKRWRPDSVRLRLTLWYVGAMALILGAYAVGVFAFVNHAFHERLEEEEHLGVMTPVDSDWQERYGAFIRGELRELAVGLAVAWPVGLLLAGAGGYALARRALSPVDQMAERARSITADRLDERLPVENANDEFGRLATVFNETLGRLEAAFERLTRFTADASHELRTPLTAIRSVGEVGLRERRDEAAYRDIIGSMLEEVDRLTRLVDTLLTLSRADAGRIKPSIERVSLRQLADEICAHLTVLAEEKRQTLRVDGGVDVQVDGDRTLLRSALINLVDNAIKHSPPGAGVSIEISNRRDAAAIAVHDTGPGIAAAHQRLVFDRFYRVDKSRSRDLGGAGLGLAIARWAVECNRGHIELESQQGAGSTFRILLPHSRPAGS